MTGHETDWVGTWFKILDEFGFQTDVTVGFIKDVNNKEIEWEKFSHAKFDGVGILLHHFRNLYLSPEIPQLPKKYIGNWLSRILGLLANFRFIPVFGAKWKKSNSDKISSQEFGIYSFLVLSESETQKISALAKSSSASVNSYLLWKLHLATQEYILPDSGPFYWMIPVNMRGAAKKVSDTSNHASWIWVDSLKSQSPKDIQNQIERRFEEGFHWGSWIALNVGKLIGHWGMRFFLKNAMHVKEHWVGTFSNLGSWRVDSPPIVIIIPTAPSTPLSASSLTINQRMTLSLHFHTNLNFSQTELKTILEHWKSLALSEKHK
jgi:hypothetical protein